jgi:hypothetical protein
MYYSTMSGNCGEITHMEKTVPRPVNTIAWAERANVGIMSATVRRSHGEADEKPDPGWLSGGRLRRRAPGRGHPGCGGSPNPVGMAVGLYTTVFIDEFGADR